MNTTKANIELKLAGAVVFKNMIVYIMYYIFFSMYDLELHLCMEQITKLAVFSNHTKGQNSV
jgi:hypothetical protein